jgi:hypothetical protein
VQEPRKASLSTDPEARAAAAGPLPAGATELQAQATALPTAGFDFYGIRVRVDGDSAEAVRRVGEDFHYFGRVLGPADKVALTIILHKRPPDYDRLPPLTASIYTPRNICYTEGDITYIDYFGRALAVYDRARNTVDVTSDSLSMLHEIPYLTILSRVGDALDRKGLHRLHALAVGREGRAALFLMPSGCGKSTLGLGLMQIGSGLELVSDDSPLIGRSGRVLPFPLRIGVLGAPPPGIPERFVQHMERMEFAPKYLVSMAAFEESLAHGELRPELIFLAERILGSECTIRRTSFLAGYKACIRHMIVGVGIYQGLEFLLRSSVLDLAKGLPSILSRAISAVTLLARARVYTLHLGRDLRLNVGTILEFLGRELMDSRSRPARTVQGP